MADEVKTGTTEEKKEITGAQPAIDMDALANKMSERLRGDMAEFLKRDEPEPLVQQPEPLRDPLGDLIRQSVAPDLRAATLKAEAAEDKADFYLTNSDAGEYRGEIEKTFNNLVKNGRPLPRADIWSWYQGQHMDVFVEKADKRKQAQILAAEGAQVVGESAGGKLAPRAGKDPYTLSDEELDKAVSGQSF